MTDQPNSNAMILKQAEGSISEALKSLEQIKTTTKQEETDKQGCIWTLDGWRKNNLKWLRKSFENE